MIYPPTLNSSQDAFYYNRASYSIYFTLNKITSIDEIGHVQIRIIKQNSNTSIANTNRYPDGTIYKPKSSMNPEDGKYQISILSSDLNAEGWKAGYSYKVLMRFGKNAMFSNVSDFASWKQTQINENAFSEWSTVMAIKAINEPAVTIKNAEGAHTDSVRQASELTTTPLFAGSCVTEPDEPEVAYKFELFSDDLDRLEHTDWLPHDSINERDLDEHRFKRVLENNKKYIVRYTIKTKNGFVKSADDYLFIVNETLLEKLKNVELECDDFSAYCSENGCINIYLSGTDISGSYVISRASEKDNFTTYEDIKYLLFSQEDFNHKLIFQDFTIESGIKYKYAILLENKTGLRTALRYEEHENLRTVDFEYSYLYRDGIQLRLMLNNKINSFKHTVLSSKLDTLGSVYPHLTKNGYAYYAEFPISGTISLLMDLDLTFFTLADDGYYYKGELVIPADKFDGSDIDHVFGTDLTHNNIFIERKFREKVEEFLNDFDYKLYRSATEGNIVIVLQNVSLTPNTTLGRMIFDFSATAYEVLEGTLEELNEYKIIDIGKFESLATDEGTRTFGQINGLFTGHYSLLLFNGERVVVTESSPSELLNEIRGQEEKPIAEGYKSSVRKILGLQVEPYPHINFLNELLTLEAERASALNSGLPTDEIDAQIELYEALLSILDTSPITKATILEINGKEIVMAPHKIYRLENIEEEINSIKLKYTSPIIINYVCELILEEDEEQGVISSIDTSHIWGLISGIFTETHDVLKNYNYQYKQSPTYRIYNRLEDKSVVKDSHGNIIVDNTNINLYKSVNILDVIKQETKKQVEKMYNIIGGFTNYNEETLQWDNGVVYYSFGEVMTIDIEADPGTVLLVGENKRPITIGATGKYILHPSSGLIDYIAFQSPAFAIINYKCSTSLLIMQKG